MAIYQVYDCDRYLIERAVSERALVFRFGLYFNALMSRSSFRNLDLDCEYNKNLGEPKRTESHPKGAIPDVLVHRRHSNDENFLVLEFKGYWNNANREADKQKVTDFTSQRGIYKYALGAFIEVGLEGPHVEFFQDYELDQKTDQESRFNPDNDF